MGRDFFFLKHVNVTSQIKSQVKVSLEDLSLNFRDDSLASHDSPTRIVKSLKDRITGFDEVFRRLLQMNCPLIVL